MPITRKSVALNLQPAQKMAILIVFIAFISISNGTHLHAQTEDQNSDAYNKNLYAKELSDIQTRFNSDLQKIQANFVKMNQQLSSTNASSSTQVIKLQETLANQRDALLNIQRYLSLPYALKSCECVNFTDSQKQQLQKQIADVSQSIKDLQTKMSYDNNSQLYTNPKCPNGNCPTVIEAKRQIQQLKSYTRIMNDTVNSDCCKKISYIFRDNLIDTSLWVYANSTQKQYMDHIIIRKGTGNMTKCPPSLPFVDQKLNQCVNCPTSTPIFNLQTRNCQQSCESKNLTLNPTTHNCDINKNCSAGQIFNNATLKCEQDLGTSSRCPQDKPVWNQQTLGCQKCPADHPYFDINVQSCRICTDNQIWDSFTQICYNKATYVSINCPEGTYYNTNTNKCESQTDPTSPPQNPTTPITPITPTNPQNQTGTSALCPPETPYWSQTQYMCARCPELTPFFNENTNNCVACPNNTLWNSVSKTCIVQGHNCKVNEFWNDKTSQCEQIKPCNADQTYNPQTGNCQSQSQTGLVGICPPQTPFWNDKTLNCEACPSAAPLFDATSQKCTVCPTSTSYDVVSRKCINVTCPQGTFYNSTTNQCTKIQCPSTQPLLNTNTGACSACPDGTTFNSATNTCDQASRGGISSVCPSDTPYWNSYKLTCQACPIGQQQNATTKICQPTVAHYAQIIHAPQIHSFLTSE